MRIFVLFNNQNNYIMEALNTISANAEVKKAIEKLILSTDTITEVEPTTEKHYALNQRFSVVRDGKEYYISIKSVDVIGQVIKSHIRLAVDTDLPKKEKPLTRKALKIQDLEAKLAKAKADKDEYYYEAYKWSLKKLRGY